MSRKVRETRRITKFNFAKSRRYCQNGTFRIPYNVCVLCARKSPFTEENRLTDAREQSCDFFQVAENASRARGFAGGINRCVNEATLRRGSLRHETARNHPSSPPRFKLDCKRWRDTSRNVNSVFRIEATAEREILEKSFVRYKVGLCELNFISR